MENIRCVAGRRLRRTIEKDDVFLTTPTTSDTPPTTTEVTVTYKGDMSFVAQGPSGHEMPMDAAPEVGGTDTAARPMEMLLASLGGCSGIDVVMILRRMRIEFDSFDVRIHATRADDHPRIFTHIETEYIVRGPGLGAHRARVERAAKLSHETYCSAAGMLNKAAELTYRVTIEDSDAE